MRSSANGARVFAARAGARRSLGRRRIAPGAHVRRCRRAPCFVCSPIPLRDFLFGPAIALSIRSVAPVVARCAMRDARGRRRRAASVTHWPSRAPAVPAGSVAGQLVFSLRGAALGHVVRSARRFAAARSAAAVGIAVPAYGAAAFAHV
ncbi:hypothetical protein C6946_15970 [Burkholderia thailandensis]|nr:hypothetical protein C6946_15970 [Burkholderia thailandensis]